jgi:hypothetical protein
VTAPTRRTRGRHKLHNVHLRTKRKEPPKGALPRETGIAVQHSVQASACMTRGYGSTAPGHRSRGAAGPPAHTAAATWPRHWTGTGQKSPVTRSSACQCLATEPEPRIQPPPSHVMPLQHDRRAYKKLHRLSYRVTTRRQQLAHPGTIPVSCRCTEHGAQYSYSPIYQCNEDAGPHRHANKHEGCHWPQQQWTASPTEAQLQKPLQRSMAVTGSPPPKKKCHLPTCAPFAKSPNCASQRTSELGFSIEYPSS